MKLLITSPDALVDSVSHAMFRNIEKYLDEFIAQEDGNLVATLSIHKEKLNGIPERFHPINIQNRLRGTPELIEILQRNNKTYDFSDFIILAASDHDFYQAFNSKLLLLSARYAFENNPSSRFWQKDYGILISTPAALKVFIDKFCPITNPWYYKLDVTAVTTIYSLTDANTFTKSGDILDITDKFRSLLKTGDSTYIGPFTNYFLVSTYRIFQEISQADIWSIYPTSSGAADDDLEHFLRQARYLYNKRAQAPLLLRENTSRKRHEMGKTKRLEDGCDSQFTSIILNPTYRGKLRGKTVCIIDDFTTYGSSCETARLLIENQSVKRLIFITMGNSARNTGNNSIALAAIFSIRILHLLRKTYWKEGVFMKG